MKKGDLGLRHRLENFALDDLSDVAISEPGSADVLTYNGSAWVNAAAASKTGTYRTLYLDAGAAVPNTTAGAATATVEAATNKQMYDVFDFDKDTDEAVQFKLAMPDEWDRGTVKVKLYWTAASGSGNVVWGVAAVASSNDDAIDSEFGTAVEVTDALITADDLHITSATAALTVGGTPALGDMTWIKIYRNANDESDTLDADARLLGVQIQYKESATEASAW